MVTNCVVKNPAGLKHNTSRLARDSRVESFRKYTPLMYKSLPPMAVVAVKTVRRPIGVAAMTIPRLNSKISVMMMDR